MSKNARANMYRQFRQAVAIPRSRIIVNQTRNGFGCSVKLSDIKEVDAMVHRVIDSLSKDFIITSNLKSSTVAANPEHTLIFRFKYKTATDQTTSNYDWVNKAPTKTAINKAKRNEMRRFFRRLINSVIAIEGKDYTMCDVYPSGDFWLTVFYNYTGDNLHQIEQQIKSSCLADKAAIYLRDNRLIISIHEFHYPDLQKLMAVPPARITNPKKYALKEMNKTPRTSAGVDTRVSEMESSDLVNSLIKSIAGGQINAAKFNGASNEIFKVLSNTHSLDDTIKLADLMGKKVQISLV